MLAYGNKKSGPNGPLFSFSVCGGALDRAKP